MHTTFDPIQIILPNSFEPSQHWYPKALNATIHPMVDFFLNLSKERIAQRYCYLNPSVQVDDLLNLLAYQPKHFFWAGTDLIHVATEHGKREMVVIETNSCPSGQKSMPLSNDNDEMGSYRGLIENTFKPALKSKRLPQGKLAVIYDKNDMESSGYACAIADIFHEEVYLIACYDEQDNSHLRINADTDILEFQNEKKQWVPLRAVFRYLTQKPWSRLPTKSKTFIFNPITACLAGGRNKMVASKAYEQLNNELRNKNLKIHTPATVWDVKKQDIPYWMEKMGGQLVIKVPYSNAGQGVFTIINQYELNAFMQQEFHYEQFIVQSLIGHYNWSSTTENGKLYHIGTMPDKQGKSYAVDVRMMINATESGFRPLAIYSRKAALPLADNLESGTSSWDILGTNLSTKLGKNVWGSDTNRLLLMDRRDFNKLGIGLDDLIQGYIQSVLATIAIDKMACSLTDKKGKFKLKQFKLLNQDPKLLEEIF